MNKELRLIITRKCNYDCYFCHGEGVEKGTKEILNENDYEYLVDFCKRRYGWDTVTLTGGEPFLRNDIKNIITKLRDIGIKITVVSNGELIDKNMECFEYIDRLNVSIHSLNEQKYQDIVQRENKLKKVIHNLYQLRKLNKKIDIRINMTIVHGQNDDINDI